MNFQVPSYPSSIRTGYSLFLLKIQRILMNFRSDEAFLISLHQKCLKNVYNARTCVPKVQMLRLTPIKVHLYNIGNLGRVCHLCHKCQK